MENKDKELREILSECGLDAPEEDEIQKAMRLIKTLYKPLEKNEIMKIIEIYFIYERKFGWFKKNRFGRRVILNQKDSERLAGLIVYVMGVK